MNVIIKILGPASFLLIANLIVNIGNYGLNLVLARWLGPAGFAEANLLATLVMLLSFIGMGIQLTVAKMSAAGDDKLISQIQEKFTYLSWLLVIVVCLCGPLLASVFNFSSFIPVFILALGIPAYLELSFTRGAYQGSDRFGALAKTYVTEMFSRVLVTLGMFWTLESMNIDSIAVALGFSLSFVFTSMLHNRCIKEEEVQDVAIEELKPYLTFLGSMMLYELSQILINNSDVLLVMHYFDAQTAGLYASLALLGRAVFFATWSVVNVLFPKVIQCKQAGEDPTRLFLTALCAVAAIGGGMVLGAWIYGEQVIGLAFGSSYSEFAEYLWLYALITTIFSCANVFVYYNLSLENYGPVYLCCMAGLLQIIFITVWHQSTSQILLCQLVAVSLLFISLLSYQFLFFQREDIAVNLSPSLI